MNLLDRSSAILFLIGPSGVGKSSVLVELSSRNIIDLTPSWTTRPSRGDEIRGSIEHRFITDQEFTKLEKDNYFMEIMHLFNLPYKFGMPYVQAPKDNKLSAMVLRTYLLPLMQRHYTSAIIYAIEDTYLNVEKRLTERRESGEPIGSRLEEYEKEIALGRKLATRTFSNDSTIKNLADKIQNSIQKDFL